MRESQRVSEKQTGYGEGNERNDHLGSQGPALGVRMDDRKMPAFSMLEEDGRRPKLSMDRRNRMTLMGCIGIAKPATM